MKAPNERPLPTRSLLSLVSPMTVALITPIAMIAPIAVIALITTAVMGAGCSQRGPDPALCHPADLCEAGLPCLDATCADEGATRCQLGDEGRLYGRTSYVDRTCVATSDTACAASSVTCATWGQCSLNVAFTTADNPRCALPSRDRDFYTSHTAGCGDVGHCVATTNATCRAARVCALNGRCTARDGICVATAQDCRDSELCAEAGKCSLRRGGCRAVSGADCESSKNCERWGQCAPRRLSCTECRRSDACGRQGLCALVSSGGRSQCRATSAAHCKRSVACRERGRCRLQRGECVN